MVVLHVFDWTSAKRQFEVGVGFLKIMVRTHCVHPEHYLLTRVVLEKLRVVTVECIKNKTL